MSIKGTLTTKNGETKIHGTQNHIETGRYSFTPDGANIASFFATRDWFFTADRKPLPVAEGVTVLDSTYYPLIQASKKWYQFQYNGTSREVTEDEVLDRLRQASSRLISARGQDMNKEEYL